MKQVRGARLFVALGASQVRRRLKHHGFGVRKIESAGRGRSLVIHTATGIHLDDLLRLFQDVPYAESEAELEQLLGDNESDWESHEV